MVQITDYVIILNDGVRKRHVHESDKGHVVRFTVQLEFRVDGEWKPAVRYDCAHGYAHMHEYDLNGTQIKRDLRLSFAHALTYADWDVNENWLEYRQRFGKGEQR